MSTTGTLTSKGQITVPKKIRETLGVETGDRIDFVAEPDGAVRMVARKRDVASLAGLLRRPGQRRLTLAEMERAIARHLATRG